MRNDCLLISRLIRREKPNEYHFHFKGWYCGRKVTNIVTIGKGLSLVKGKDYIIHLNMTVIKEEELRGNIKRVKELSLERDPI